MVSTSGGLFGDLFKDLMFHFKQNMNSFHKKIFKEHAWDW